MNGTLQEFRSIATSDHSQAEEDSKNTLENFTERIVRDCIAAAPIKVSIKLKRTAAEASLSPSTSWMSNEKVHSPKIVTPATEATRYVENLLLGRYSGHSIPEDISGDSAQFAEQQLQDYSSENPKDSRLTVYIRRKKPYSASCQGRMKSKKI